MTEGACSSEEECWEYLDPQSVKRGPFSRNRMLVWYEHSLLPQELKVRYEARMPFIPIRELFHPPLKPFKSRPRLAPNEPAQPSIQDSKWQYLDTKGNVQGPFSSQQMALWYEHRMLPKTLQLRRTTETDYRTIAEYFPPPLEAFKSQPAKPGLARLDLLFANAAAANATAAAAAAQVQATQVKKGEKGKGKREDGAGGEAKKGRGKAKEKEANGWSWSPEHGWSCNDKSWWEWSSWNGWEETWENGKSDWKCAEGNKEKGEKGVTAVQAAFGSLKWGPPFKDADLFPEDAIRRVLDEGIVWEERWISPLAVRFSQGKIHPFFHERGPISEVMLQIKLKDGKRKRIDPPFPPIRLLHLKEQGVLVTLDNRRLYALQRFALQEWPSPCLVKALCVDELTPTRLRAENRKFTNRLCGLQLEVESRSNAFDTFSWVTEAAHTEGPRFFRPVALRAYDKAVSLLPALVVHALLCRKLRPYLQSRWLLLQFLAVLLPNPQQREFACKRVLLQHILELSKPTSEVIRCPRTCVGYKTETVVSLGKGRSNVSSKLSVERPLKLLQAPGPLSDVQRRVLAALLPMCCLPYARTVLRGATRDWVLGLLLAWGKVAASSLELQLP
mmetsp:Transcript_71028/g.169479  ORF Transcript_71028/g.169479 Transcript_71028/m.169479 type:complete len:615 (-) Transcript_71028:55-1899(-)